MKTCVRCQVRVEGFHNWPQAPEKVSFLQARHRHIFVITADKEVASDGNQIHREIEFILLGRDIQHYLLTRYDRPAEFGPKSCEMIANELVNQFDLDRCEVSEDGENGSIVYS